MLSCCQDDQNAYTAQTNQVLLNICENVNDGLIAALFEITGGGGMTPNGFGDTLMFCFNKARIPEQFTSNTIDCSPYSTTIVEGDT